LTQSGHLGLRAVDTDNVNKWVSLLANFGVLAGIVFLALEIQQSNKIAMATAEMSIRDHYFENNQMVVVEDRVAELFVKAKNPNAEFSAIETEKINSYIWMNLNTWRAIEVAYSNGLLPIETFEIIDEEIDFMLQTYPGMRRAMQETADNFSSHDVRYVSEAMRKALPNQN